MVHTNSTAQWIRSSYTYIYIYINLYIGRVRREANPGRVPGVFDVSVSPLPSEDAGRTGLNGFFAFCSRARGEICATLRLLVPIHTRVLTTCSRVFFPPSEISWEAYMYYTYVLLQVYTGAQGLSFGFFPRAIPGKKNK